MKKVISVCLILFSFYGSAQQTIKFIDERDGKTYQTVVIGNQTWMAENLNVDRFRNGDIIPEAKTKEEWQKAGDEKQPAWCYYDNDPKNGTKYGKLYNWYAVNDQRGLAPKGWHIPNLKEWDLMEITLDPKSGMKLKSISGWPNYYTANKGEINGNGTNESGFNGLPGGSRFYIFDWQKNEPLSDEFQFIGENTIWWTSTENFNNEVYTRGLFYTWEDKVYRDFCYKFHGHSIRCVKD
jgi:uncharacterized protein (TIGR02145 family)